MKNKNLIKKKRTQALNLDKVQIGTFLPVNAHQKTCSIHTTCCKKRPRYAKYPFRKSKNWETDATVN